MKPQGFGLTTPYVMRLHNGVQLSPAPGIRKTDPLALKAVIDNYLLLEQDRKYTGAEVAALIPHCDMKTRAALIAAYGVKPE